MKRSGFTMIELVFVIVILGILASVAVSKMAVTADDARITKGKGQISAIRSAIALQRSKNMMRGFTNGGNPTHLDDEHNTNDGELFDGNTSIGELLDYPIRAVAATKTGWRKTAQNSYVYRVTNVDVNFTYIGTSGNFNCTHAPAATATPAQKLCNTLTQ